MPQPSLVDAFPQEIIDQILDNLSINPIGVKYDLIKDRHAADLRACSLVCRAFAPRCQYHLFSILRLREAEEEDWIEWERSRREEIYKVLLSKPHVRNGVRHVSAFLGKSGMKSVVHEELGDLAQPGLLLLLRELPISSIEILGEYYRDSETYPNPRPIEHHFIRPCIQPASITFLRISHIVITTPVLAYFPNLADLYLSETMFEEARDYSKIAAPRPRARLRTLRVSPTALLEEIVCVCGSDALPLFDLTRLRVLETPLPGDDEDTLVLGRVLDMCAPHVEELDLHDASLVDPRLPQRSGALPSIGTEFESLKADTREALWDVGSIGHFPKLDTLYLWSGLMTVHEKASVSDNPLIDYCHFLARVPSPNTLRRLDMNLCISCLDTLSPLCCLDAPGWDGLDYEIMRISNGKALKVDLNITWNLLRYSRDLNSSRDDGVWERVMEMLQTGLVPAIRGKLQRVGQSAWIEFGITSYIQCVCTYQGPE